MFTTNGGFIGQNFLQKQVQKTVKPSNENANWVIVYNQELKGGCKQYILYLIYKPKHQDNNIKFILLQQLGQNTQAFDGLYKSMEKLVMK